jgi:regulator of replication initiation timing
MRLNSKVNCCDLYDNAAEKLKTLDNDIDKTIWDLSKDVEARGVPKNKVARQVVKELTARKALSQSRIYEGLGIEYKRKYKKRVSEKTFLLVENISEESSTPQAILLAASSRGLSETLEDINGRPDIKLVSEEQKKKEMPGQEDEMLKGIEKDKSEPELIREIAYLRGKIAKSKSDIEELKKQLAEKTEEASELRRDNEALKEKTQPELLRELQEKFHDQPGLIDAKTLHKISVESGKNLQIMLERYNFIIQDAIDLGQPVPVGTYIITKPDMKLVPIRILVDFDKRTVRMSLWEKKVQSLLNVEETFSTDGKYSSIRS